MSDILINKYLSDFVIYQAYTDIHLIRIYYKFKRLVWVEYLPYGEWIL